MRRRRRVIALAVAAVVMAGTASVASAPPAAAAVTVGDVVVTPATVGLENGFTRLVIDVSLQSTEPLDDMLSNGTMGGGEAYTVLLRRADDPSWLQDAEIAGASTGWTTLTRVSGSATDGVWRGTATAAPGHTGIWRVTTFGTVTTEAVDLSDRDITVTIGDLEAGPPWVVRPVFGTPIKIVTGQETWRPQARVTDRADGSPISAVWTGWAPSGSTLLQPWYPAGTSFRQADAAGYITLPPESVTPDSFPPNIHVFGRYASRGYAWQGGTILTPYVKWQANSRFAVSGRTVTVTGNAWPAPSVYAAPNRNVHLQQLVNGTWVTVATGTVRETGRYTVTWTGPAGRVTLRVYKPGGSFTPGGVTRSEGTKLASTTLVLT
ncbi:hypothetical protein [Pseudactinotalea suaedae]|uniref:hypothetical protein n=1 Tax=Pseudactinotalea suaedae TaxID=1524924 RepID=UPI0012E2BD36|nr:hypothetical protein [Pseudactinotalea suaedae]